MAKVAQTKKKGEKPSEKEASGDGDGFETILSAGVGESTSLTVLNSSFGWISSSHHPQQRNNFLFCRKCYRRMLPT
jgi:hypothetical protein